MLNKLIHLATACTLAGALYAAAAEPARTLEHVAVIPAPVDAVWTAFTNADEAKQWMVARAEIDLRVGGEMRTSYVADSTLDDDNTIVNRIISYEPQRMLSIRNVRAPASFENAQLFQQTWSVIYFESLGPDRTRVRTVGLGYGEGAEWDDIYRMFEVGNTWVLHELQKHFGGVPGEVLVNPGRKDADNTAATAPDDTDRVAAILDRMCGTWEHDGTGPNGSALSVRNTIRPAAAHQSFVMTGERDRGGGFRPHATTLACRLPDAEGGGIVFNAVDEHGGLARGRIDAGDDGHTLIWDWPVVALDGTRTRYRIKTRLAGDDHYTMRLEQLDAAGAVVDTGPDIEFVRAEHADSTR